MYIGYGLEMPDFQPLMAELASSGNASVRLLIEAHFPAHNFHPHRLRALAQQRERLWGACKVLLMTRVREPLAFYWSFFTWSLDRYHGHALHSDEALADAFWEWAPANLQANLLWRADAAVPAEASARAIDASSRARAFAENGGDVYISHFGKAPMERLLSALALYDLVAVAEEWDASLLIAAHAVGLRHLLYHRAGPPSCANGSCKRPLSSICPNRQICEARLRDRAPVDYHLHDYARRRFAAAKAQMGPHFPQWLAEFQRTNRAYQAKRRAQGNASLNGRLRLHRGKSCMRGAHTPACRSDLTRRQREARCDFRNYEKVVHEPGQTIVRPRGVPFDVYDNGGAGSGRCCSASHAFCQLVYTRRGHSLMQRPAGTRTVPRSSGRGRPTCIGTEPVLLLR